MPLALTWLAWGLSRETLAAAHGIVCWASTDRVPGPRGRRIYETRIVSGDKELLEEYSVRLRSLVGAVLSPTEYEREWAQIYNELASITAINTIQRSAA